MKFTLVLLIHLRFVSKQRERIRYCLATSQVWQDKRSSNVVLYRRGNIAPAWNTVSRPVVPWGAMANQFTLSQPGEANYAHHINTGSPLIFRPSYGPGKWAAAHNGHRDKVVVQLFSSRITTVPFRSLALNSYIPGILCGPLRDAYIWHTDKSRWNDKNTSQLCSTYYVICVYKEHFSDLLSF